MGGDQRLSPSPFGCGPPSPSAFGAFVRAPAVRARSGRCVIFDPLAVRAEAAHRYFPFGRLMSFGPGVPGTTFTGRGGVPTVVGKATSVACPLGTACLLDGLFARQSLADQGFRVISDPLPGHSRLGLRHVAGDLLCVRVQRLQDPTERERLPSVPGGQSVDDRRDADAAANPVRQGTSSASPSRARATASIASS